MTHPTDDEIMELAVRYFGEQAAHASTGLKRFARALLAQQSQEPKAEDSPSDAELLDWLEEKHYALHPIKEDQGDDTCTLWWQVTDKDKSISGHPLGNIRAAIRAARAAERKA